MITLIIGIIIGFASAAMGYGVSTWQFWLIAMPLAFIIGLIIRR